MRSGLAAALCILALAACAKAPKPAAPTKPGLAAANDRIETAAINGDTLTVQADASPCLTQETGCASAVVSDVAKAIQADPDLASTAKFAVFRLSHQVQDRLGTKSTAPLLQVRFAMDDLRHANLTNLSLGQTMDLAQAVIVDNRPAADDVALYCLGEPDSAHFCAKARLSRPQKGPS